MMIKLKDGERKNQGQREEYNGNFWFDVQARAYIENTMKRRSGRKGIRNQREKNRTGI